MKNEKQIKRHAGWYRAIRAVGMLILKKYSYKTDKMKLPETCLILSNHLTEVDYLMVGAAFPEFKYFVCGEHLIRSGIGLTIQRIADPIPMPRGGRMAGAVKETVSRLRAGYSVIMFPEGCRSFDGETLPVSDATAKLLKLAGCGLVTYRISGGYFIAPRWGYKTRKGHAEGKIVNYYSSEQIKNMSVGQITGIINADLHENAHETQKIKQYKYKSKHSAEGIENYLLICPKCHAYDSFEAKGNDFHCTNCGLSAHYNAYGSFDGKDLPFDNVYDWGKWMNDTFDADMAEKSFDECLFTENVTFYEILPEHQRKDIADGILSVYRDRIDFDGKVIYFRDICAKSLLYFGKTWLFTCKDGYFGFTGERFHAWKLDRLYDIYG